MQIINTTPLDVRATLGELDGMDARIGAIFAKATMKWTPSGAVEFDTDAPIPLLDADTEHPYGIMPADTWARRGNVFEVCVLGAAYGGKYGSKRVDVRLAIGQHERRLAVFGERGWVGKDKKAIMSEPVAFASMPMTWSNAYGGSANAFVDQKNFVPVQDTWNPLGKGFDAEKAAAAVVMELGAADGFPIIPQYVRLLPNLEDPRALMQRFDDQPLPACWAPLPLAVPFRLYDYMQQQGNVKSIDEIDVNAEIEKAQQEMLSTEPGLLDTMMMRAPRDMRFETHLLGQNIVMEGMSPRGKSEQFLLPDLRVFADFAADGAQGTVELTPHMLLLFPDEARFTLLFRTSFSVGNPNEKERSFRMRTNMQTTPVEGSST